MTTSLFWWRSWHGAPMDHKWAVIAARSGVKAGIVSAVAWALMDYASQQPERGTITGFDVEEYAVFSGFSEVEVSAVIEAMVNKKIIVDGRLTNWEKRQPKREDDSTPRVTKFRELKRNVTQSNADDVLDKSRVDKIKDTDKIREEAPTDNDLFDVFQDKLISVGILMTGKGDIDALNKTISEGCNLDDLEKGIAWRVDHNDGKPIRYISQLVGPVITSKQKRLQTGQGHSIPVDDQGRIIYPAGYTEIK